MLHRTISGYIQQVDSYGHGRNARRQWAFVPAHITVEDGDGHFTVWRYTGLRADAMEVAVSFIRSADPVLIVAEGSTAYPLPRQQWADGVEEVICDEDGEPLEIRFHPDRHPGGLIVI